jgi:amino acid adenylation domain-containing protein
MESTCSEPVGMSPGHFDTLPQAFRAQARRTPAAVALTDGDRRFTYAELDAQTDRLAARLAARGVRPGDCVGLHLDRSAEFVLAVLAILKAGAAYVPLATDYPVARLRLMVEGARIRLLLTGPADAATDFSGVNPLPFRDLRDGPEAPAARHLPPAAGTDAAYVMFTSGSTGRPKGVIVPHRAITRLVFGQDYLPFGPGLRMLLISPTSFDASTLELWAPLLHGGVCVVHPERHLTLSGLERVIRDHAITSLWLTASLFNQIIDLRPEILRPLRHLLTGGEALSVAHVRRALLALPETRLINGYGPTEGTTFTTTFPIPRDFAGREAGSIPIGRPLANTRCLVLDERQQPVATGEAGELYVGGDGLALGYLDDPALTAARFVPDPTAHDGPGGARLYRTGDLVRQLPDGSLDFVRRLDEQVKIRGFRIEPGEIEAALRQHPAIRQAVVAPRPTSDGRLRLLAWFLLAEGTTLSPEDLRAHLRGTLPEHMIPSGFARLPNLPLTANGKVDRAALPDIAGDSGFLLRAALTARSATEARLATLWAEALEMPVPDTDADFVQLGGDSLHLLRLALLIERHFGKAVPVTALHAAPRLSQMAAALDRAHSPDTGPGNSAAASPAASPGPPPKTAVYLPESFGVGFFKPAMHAALGGLCQLVDGLQLPGFAADEAPLLTVEACADFLLPQLVQRVPTGTFFLIGYSFGGYLALELARRLQAGGRAVDTVFLVDAVCPPSLKRLSWWGSLATIGDHLWNHGPRHRRQFFSTRIRQWLDAAATSRIGWLRWSFRRINPRSQTVEHATFAKMLQAALTAEACYTPAPYAGRVVLLRARERDPHDSIRLSAADADNGWRALMQGPFEVVPIPGSHNTVLHEPDVTALSAALRTGLQARLSATR